MANPARSQKIQSYREAVSRASPKTDRHGAMPAERCPQLGKIRPMPVLDFADIDCGSNCFTVLSILHLFHLAKLAKYAMGTL